MAEQDEMFQLMLQLERGRAGKIPPGSPNAYVYNNWPTPGEMQNTIESIDLTSEPFPMDASQSTDKLMELLTQHTNPAAVEAFLASAPESQNIEDRRGEGVNDAIRRYLQANNPNELPMEGSDEDFRPEESAQLPIPNFDYRKRSR